MRAFSLVELSIVLVILGLLAGGILAGQSLIRASELRSITTEFQRYQTATHAFRDRYFSLPGDFNGAINVWGRSADCLGTAVPGTCNGNADGVLQYSSVTGGTGEAYRFWQHLALAGLIEGHYTGNSGPDNTGDYTIGGNAPASKMAAAGWMASYRDANTSQNIRSFDYDYRSWMGIGAKRSATAAYLDDAFLKTQEAWNIDSKFDDGMPAQGNVHGFATVTSCTTAASETIRTGMYKLNDSAGKLCALLFKY